MNQQTKKATFVQTHNEREYKLVKLVNQASIDTGTETILIGGFVLQIELEQFIEDNQMVEVEIKVAQ